MCKYIFLYFFKQRFVRRGGNACRECISAFRIFINTGFRQELRTFIPMALQIYTSVLAMHFNSLSRNSLCSPPPVVNYNAIVRCAVDVV